jgi:hypothetical protein
MFNKIGNFIKNHKLEIAIGVCTTVAIAIVTVSVVSLNEVYQTSKIETIRHWIDNGEDYVDEINCGGKKYIDVKDQSTGLRTILGVSEN